MPTSATLEEQTVITMFQKLEQSGIRYALLRNFENFPHFGHDVDVMIHEDDLPRWREVAREVAQENGWDAVTECHHWAQSPSNLHNVEVFRFYKRDPLTFIQVDVFHGYLLWGLPLYTEAQVLGAAVSDSEQRFTQIDPMIEHVNHFLQIQKMLTYSDITAELFGTEQKTERYRNKVLEYHAVNGPTFETTLKRLFGEHGLRALEALKDNNMSIFAGVIKAGKRHFFLRYVIRHPVKSLLLLMHRLLYKHRSFNTNPCGFTLGVDAKTDGEKARLNEACEQLMVANALIGYSVKWADDSSLHRQEYTLIERGGIAIKWQQDGEALSMGEFETGEELAQAILGTLMERHSQL